MNSQPNDTVLFKISEAKIYFIYSFMCDQAVEVKKASSLGGTLEYCEEFMEPYGLYKRPKNKYDFAYEHRISRQLVLRMPYIHIKDSEFSIKAKGKIAEFLGVPEMLNRFIDCKDCVFKIYEDGRGIFRFSVDIPKECLTLTQVVRFMDIGSLPELWKTVRDKIEKKIKDISAIQGSTAWVEIGMEVVPEDDNIIWQTPQILLHLKMDGADYKKFLEADCDTRLRWIHYILNKSKTAQVDTMDTTFARYFTSTIKDDGKFDASNMCYDSNWYYTLSPDVLLLISNNEEPLSSRLTPWVEVRLLELYEFLRMRWYSLFIADELLDKTIQTLSDTRSKIEQQVKLDETLNEIREFLKEWINTKCIILRTFEDPSTQRCAGLTFNLLYKKGEDYFLIKELENMVRFKLEHIDKVYTDIMDLARINHFIKK